MTVTLSTQSPTYVDAEAFADRVACKAGELRRVAARFGLDSSAAEDLAQTAIAGFLLWLRSRKEGLPDPECVAPFLHERLCWVRDTQWRRRVRELVALENKRACEPDQLRQSVANYRRRETATLLRVLIERRFETFYAEFAARYRPEVARAVRELCGEKFPGDLFAQFYNGRLIVFAEMDGDTRCTDDVAAIGHRLGLKLNATQAALTRAQKPWRKVEQIVFGGSSHLNYTERRRI